MPCTAAFPVTCILTKKGSFQNNVIKECPSLSIINKWQRTKWRGGGTPWGFLLHLVIRVVTNELKNIYLHLCTEEFETNERLLGNGLWLVVCSTAMPEGGGRGAVGGTHGTNSASTVDSYFTVPKINHSSIIWQNTEYLSTFGHATWQNNTYIFIGAWAHDSGHYYTYYSIFQTSLA